MSDNKLMRIQRQDALTRLDPPDPNCGWCIGTGVVDSGGFTPWDTPIDIPCGCVYPKLNALEETNNG